MDPSTPTLSSNSPVLHMGVLPVTEAKPSSNVTNHSEGTNVDHLRTAVGGNPPSTHLSIGEQIFLNKILRRIILNKDTLLRFRCPRYETSSIE